MMRESIALSGAVGDRAFFAQGVEGLGWALLSQGRFAEACAVLQESVALYDELRLPADVSAGSRLHLGLTELSLGRYEVARAQVQDCLARAREADQRGDVAWSLHLLGAVDLADGAYAEADRRLRESVALWREVGNQEGLRGALAYLSVVSQRLGHVQQARQQVCEALQTASAMHTVLALPAAALLLADAGQVDRAVETYALAARHPHVANSRWFEDVAGKQITAIAATLPPEVVAAAQERGRARDLRATAEELLEEWEGN
jgi:tetratricopeptide (TPR) repeat protein